MELFEIIKQLFSEEGIKQLIENYKTGMYIILFLVIFCETGLVVTPFLPGDSLLFAVGALGAGVLDMPLLCLLLILAAVLGDAVNYSIGHYLGPKVFSYEDSWLLNKRHLLKAQTFYEKWGAKAIVLARFAPIVRTFAPFVAGIGKMRYPRFFVYNVVGGVAWVLTFLLGGYFFREIPFVKQNFKLVIAGIIVVSVLPIVWEFVRAWRNPEKELSPIEKEEGAPA